jgi:spermidine synthase
VRRPLKAYARIELAIAVFGVVSVPFLECTGSVVEAFYGLAERCFPVFVLLKLALAFTVLLIPTFLMGASLPVLVIGLAGEESFRKRVSLLYGVNTLGAAAGALASGLFLLPALGVTGTVLAAAAAGIAVAAAAFQLDRQVAPRQPDLAAPTGESAAVGAERPSQLLVAALAFSGGLNIVYQVAWTRLLVPVVGSSTYAFTLILSTFLVGLGAGSLLAAVPLFKRCREQTAVALMVALTSVTVLAGLFFVNDLPDLFAAMVEETGSRTALLFLSQAALAGGLILLPAVGMGATLPLAVAGRKSDIGDGARAVGGIYAANTLGAIFGSILGGFILLPWLGSGGALELAAASGLVLALVLLLHGRQLTWGRRLVCFGGVSATVVVALNLLPQIDARSLQRGIFRNLQAEAACEPTNGDVIFSREGKNCNVTVVRDPDSTYLKVNGKTDASTRGDLDTQYLLGHLPLFLHRLPESVCIIGYGSGATVYAVTTHPSVRRVDVAEIEDVVIEASRFFRSINHGVLGDPRVRVHMDDGRSFLRYRRDSYDVIISEPSNPWIAGVSSLFTVEYYRSVRERLKPGGRFTQWVQLYEVSNQTLSVMLRTLAGVFPHVAIFICDGDLICVASDEAVSGDLASHEERFQIQEVRESLNRIGVRNPWDLFSNLLRSFPDNRDLFESAVENTDDNLWLEYRAPIEMFQGASPHVAWLPPADYVHNVARLFRDQDPKELTLALARSLERRGARLWLLIGRLGAAVDTDDALDAELAAVSARAKARFGELLLAEDRLREGAALLKEGKLKEAVERLEKVVAADPDFGPAHRLLGLPLLRIGAGRKGLEHLVRAINLQPDDYESRTNLASLLLVLDAKGDEDQARRAIEIHPRYALAWEIHAKTLAKRGELAAARATMAEAKTHLSRADFAVLEKKLEPVFEAASVETTGETDASR